MADDLKSVRRGEAVQLSASAWNKLMDMARRDGQRGASGVADPLLAKRDRDIVLIKNVSGIEYPRWGVLGLGAPIYLPKHNPPSGKQALPQDFAQVDHRRDASEQHAPREGGDTADLAESGKHRPAD